MTHYSSALDIANLVSAAAPDRMNRLIHNTRSPDHSAVWIYPDPKETPAHHRAKLGFWPWGENGTEVYVHWCIEKGPEGSAGANFDPSEVLGASWAWMRFLEHARNGTFDEELKTAESAAGVPLTVRVTIETATPGRGRGYRPGSEQTEVKHNERLSLAADVRTVVQLLEDQPGRDWVRCDFGVGVVLPLRADTFAPHEVWTRILLPWVDWL